MDKDNKGPGKALLGLLRKPVSKWTRNECAYWAKLLRWTKLLHTDKSNIGILTRAWIEEIKQKFTDPDRLDIDLLPKKKVKKKPGRPPKKYNDLSPEQIIELVEDIRSEIAGKRGLPREKVFDSDVARYLAEGYVKDNPLSLTGKHIGTKFNEFKNEISDAKKLTKKKNSVE